MNERRRELWDTYRDRLGSLEGVTVPFGPAHSPGEWTVQPYILPVVLTFEQDRERIRRRLAERGIQTSVHYPPVHLFQLYRDRFGYGPGDLPVTEWVASNIISLPFYPSMTEDNLEFVVDALKSAM